MNIIIVAFFQPKANCVSHVIHLYVSAVCWWGGERKTCGHFLKIQIQGPFRCLLLILHNFLNLPLMFYSWMLQSLFCLERELCLFPTKICWHAESLGFPVFLVYVLFTLDYEYLMAETVYVLLCLYSVSHNRNPVQTGGIQGKYHS